MLHWDLLFLPDFFFIGNSYIHSTLISCKPFFIFNEPLSSLDSHSRQTMFTSSSHRKKKITQTRIYLHLYLSQFIPSFKTPNLNFPIRTQLSPLQPNLFSFAIQSLLQNTIFDKYPYHNAVDENESGRKNIRFGLWLGILIKLEEVGDKKIKINGHTVFYFFPFWRMHLEDIGIQRVSAPPLQELFLFYFSAVQQIPYFAC